MRAVSVTLAAVGGCALAASMALLLATGNIAGARWLLIGPTPFYAVGLIAVLRRPGHPIVTWLIAAGTTSVLDVCLEWVLRLHSGWHWSWAVALMRTWAANASTVAGTFMIALFPTGRPQRWTERSALYSMAVLGALLPLLYSITRPHMAKGTFAPATEAAIASPFVVPAAAQLGTLTEWLHNGFQGLAALGVVLLYLHYRRSSPSDRRRIRWLLVGMASAFFTLAAVTMLAWLLEPSAMVLIFTLGYPVFAFLALGSMIVALSNDGVFGIDEPSRRSMVYRTMWVFIALAYVMTTATLGVLAGRYLPIGVTVFLVASAALLFQPVQRRLERLADRWVFGARLNGYDVLTSFGTMLNTSGGPTDLLPKLATAIRHGLGLHWARVRLNQATADGTMAIVGSCGIGPDDDADPALVVPLTSGGGVFGRIECGPRPDGPFLDEDRRLLGHLTGQAAAALRAIHLAGELGAQLEITRRQAVELTASRARVAQAQDAERLRIQRALHDGVQQDLVVLTAMLTMARERLRRGNPRVDESLDELQRDLGTVLANVREVAHAIHPPVLADQGLLEAIEAHAARLPLEVVIDADPVLRGVRYSQSVEAAGWYVVSEALTNVVKHAAAHQVLISLRHPPGRLLIEIRDDGRGFHTGAAAGLGLAGMADRLSIVEGTLRIESTPGQGTAVCAEIPLTERAPSHG